MSIQQKCIGQTKKGENVVAYTLTNAKGMKVTILNLGGIITEILVADKNGKLDNVNLNYENLENYENNCGYLGALIGRVGNRIGKAKFELEGKTYCLVANNGENNLHGGPEGFNNRIWDVKTEEVAGEDRLHLSLVSPNGDQGFPGTLNVCTTYSWNNDNALTISYSATTDKTTLVNLTNHAYFNLEGNRMGTVADHELQIMATKVNEVSESLIPTGNFINTEDVCYGFSKVTRMGDVLAEIPRDAVLKNAGGVDFNYCAGKAGESKCIATVYAPKSGRFMEVTTDQPGVQCYTGQYLEDEGYTAFSGMCLETQHYPDAIHHPNFPSIVLTPSKEYKTFTTYKFSIK